MISSTLPLRSSVSPTSPRAEDAQLARGANSRLQQALRPRSQAIAVDERSCHDGARASPLPARAPVPVLGYAEQRLGESRLGTAIGEEELKPDVRRVAAAVAWWIGCHGSGSIAWAIDPAVPLVVGTWSVREGIEGSRDGDCC